MSVPFCVDCKLYRDAGGESHPFGHRCWAGDSRYKVTGKRGLAPPCESTCEAARAEDGICGPGARLFEPKENE